MKKKQNLPNTSYRKYTPHSPFNSVVHLIEYHTIKAQVGGGGELGITPHILKLSTG